MTIRGRGVTEMGSAKIQGATENNPVTVDVAAHGQDSTYSIPDTGAATADFVMDEGAQTVAGVKTFSGANVHSGANTFSGVNTFSTMFRMPVAAVTPAGSVQGDAAALSEGINIATGADSTKGVILPAAASGAVAIVKSVTAAQTLKVYPQSGEAINALSADAALTMAAATSAMFFSNGTGWYSLPLLPS